MARVAGCLPARLVTISLRTRGKDNATKYKVVCPEEWNKSQFLDYVRKVHPEDTARIVEWPEARTKQDDPKVWLSNPLSFENYKKGKLK